MNEAASGVVREFGLISSMRADHALVRFNFCHIQSALNVGYDHNFWVLFTPSKLKTP